MQHFGSTILGTAVVGLGLPSSTDKHERLVPSTPTSTADYLMPLRRPRAKATAPSSKPSPQPSNRCSSNWIDRPVTSHPAPQWWGSSSEAWREANSPAGARDRRHIGLSLTDLSIELKCPVPQAPGSAAPSSGERSGRCSRLADAPGSLGAPARPPRRVLRAPPR